MSQISDFAARQQQRNDAITASLNGISGDLQRLADLIAQLQSTQGQITPEDQALLDQIEAATDAIKDRVSTIDAQNPEPTA